MTCLDCAAPMPPSLMPLCTSCARVAVNVLGSVDARIDLLEEK